MVLSTIPKSTPLLCVVGWCDRKFRYLPEDVGFLQIKNDYMIVNDNLRVQKVDLIVIAIFESKF